MRKYLLRVFESYIKKWNGKLGKQTFFERLYNISIKGMNFGNGVWFEESGELFVIRFVRQFYVTTNKLTVFDVGGNIGNYSKALSTYIISPSVIYSFEPSQKTFKLFQSTTKGIDNIIANNFGFSNKKERLELYTNEEGSGLASVYKRDLEYLGVKMNRSETIQLTTIDIFCEENNIQHIHFLKLDIEGHELRALEGAQRMMTNGKIDFIQFEFGGCNIDSRTYFKDFYRLLHDKYKIYRIVTDGLYEISAYKETYEIFTTINFLAQRKTL